MPYPMIAAGMRLTAATLAALQMQSVTQTAEQSVTNSTTLTDSNIVVPLEPNAVYRYWLLVGYQTTEAADLKFAWTAPSGGEVQRYSWGYGPGGTGSLNNFNQVNFRRPLTATKVRIGATEGTQSYYEQGLFEGGVGGVATFRFAQDTATATPASIIGSSRVDYLRIG